MVELREAGIVHALMEVLRDDTGGGSRQNLPDTGSFTRRAIQVQGSSGAAVTVGFDKPSFAVCHALLAMQDTVRPIALDIVTAPGFAPALVHSYKIFPSEMLLGPAHLLAAVVQALKSDSRHESLRCAMANELISAGLLETLSSVLNPTWERLSNPILFAFTTIVEWAGFVGMPADILSQNTACLINFIRCCRDEVDASSAEVLLQLVSLAASRSRPSGCCHSRLQVLEALVKNLVGFMNTGKPTLAIHAVPIVVHRVQAHKELINMAVDSGFIRGMLRLLQLVRIGAEESTDEGEMFSTGGAVMYRGVLDFLAFAKEGHVTEALTSGLVAELKACVTGDVTAQQWFVMQTCELLLVLWGLRGPAAKLRESGIVPGILVKVANGSNNEGVLAFADWLGKLSQSKVKRAKVFVAELLAAGALEKLTQSSLATSENHVTLGSILQELQRFALRNHGEVKRARSRVTGDGSPRGSRKQVRTSCVPLGLAPCFLGTFETARRLRAFHPLKLAFGRFQKF